jgi:hypothetical protein
VTEPGKPSLRQRLANVGRVALLVVGLCFVTFLIWRTGPAKVAALLVGAAWLFPVIVLCEAGLAVCDAMAVRSLFREHAKEAPVVTWVRACTMAYAFMVLLPAGRAAGEVARATILGKHTGLARSVAASVGFQASNLYAVGAVSAVAGTLSLAFGGEETRTLTMALFGNVAITATFATGLMLILRSKRAAAFVAKRLPAKTQTVDDVALVLAKPLPIPRGAAWCTAGRLIQLLQHIVFIAAVGGGLSFVRGSFAQGVELVGATLGDAIPNQMGAVEGANTIFAHAMGLTTEQALSIPLLFRLSQYTLATLALITTTLARRREDAGPAPAPHAAGADAPPQP